jgi:hypothetical protein
MFEHYDRVGLMANPLSLQPPGRRARILRDYLTEVGAGLPSWT